MTVVVSLPLEDVDAVAVALLSSVLLLSASLSVLVSAVLVAVVSVLLLPLLAS